MAEAANLAKLVAVQTPLFGGQNPDLTTTDFSAITPRAAVASTPNPLSTGLTPGRGGLGPGATEQRNALLGATPGYGGSRAIAGVGMTPSVAGTPLRDGMATPGRGGHGFGATPMRTPIRDELSLNDPEYLLAQVGKAFKPCFALLIVTRLAQMAYRNPTHMSLPATWWLLSTVFAGMEGGAYALFCTSGHGTCLSMPRG